MHIHNKSVIHTRRIIMLILTLALVMTMMPAAVFAAGSDLPDLNEKSIYYTPDYRSGDCILSSAKSMLRRAAIARGSHKWDSITNTTLRGTATVKGKLFRNTFTYTNDGFSYKIINQELKGNANNKMKDITAILANHPEGVVVWGPSAARSGPHAVLAVGQAGGVLYAIDSTHNNFKSNVGIEPWGKTTMKTVDKLTDVWYICSVNGSSASVAPTGDSTLCATGVNPPASLTRGKGFDVTGSVQSNYRITSVTIAVLDSKGKAVISRTVSPAAYWFPLSSLDSVIKFGTLTEGSYTYRITAADEKKSNAVLHENKFEVVSLLKGTINGLVGKVTESSLRGESISQPDTLKQGSGFTVKGKIVSNYKIKSVTAAVYDEFDNVVISAGAKPNARSYKLANLDAKLKFGKVPAGTFRYVVIATDEKGTVTLADKEFTVTAKTQASSSSGASIKLSSAKTPASLKKGKSFSIKGKISSSKKIQNVEIQVLNSGGKAVITASSKPGKKTYNIKKLDSKIRFGKLAKGSYLFVVKARSGSEWKTLLSKDFTVR